MVMSERAADAPLLWGNITAKQPIWIKPGEETLWRVGSLIAPHDNMHCWRSEQELVSKG